MKWFAKYQDPLAAKSRALDKQIASLEKEIRQLSHSLENVRNSPAEPEPEFHHHQSAPRPPRRESPPRDEVSSTTDKSAATAELSHLYHAARSRLQALRGRFGHPDPNRTKLVNYLAAGSFEGMRPLRYERRIARNRILFLTLCFLLVFFTILLLLWP